MGSSLPGMRPRRTPARACPKYMGTASVPSSCSRLLHAMPWYSGITTRMSIPRCRRLRGSTPATSASPPVFRKGATSEATKSTFNLPSPGRAVRGSGATAVGGGETPARRPRLAGTALATARTTSAGTDPRLAAGLPRAGPPPTFNVGAASPSARLPRAELLRRVDPVVDVREDVVLRFNGCQVLLVHLPHLQFIVKSGEADDVFVQSTGGVGNRCSRGHDEGPVARLRQHEFACRLLESAHGQRVRHTPVAARDLDHALARGVDVAPGPGVAFCLLYTSDAADE